MSFDCGFDIFPPLLRTPENKTRYGEFLHDITTIFKTDLESRTLVLPTDSDRPKVFNENFIHFVFTYNPRIPIDPSNCDLFLGLRSSSVFNASILDHMHELASIARHHFGSRVHVWVNQSDIYSREELNRAEDQVLRRSGAKDGSDLKTLE
ncbi:SET domain protein [Fusarium beomiforme]|uniref:SET domain protein n=1 Tax=Fusarium beomiforme TaxID=44412 RepID=A0A9P5A9X4_9HYPO|nr:SET domain protein [Fusarium beomiforme]